MTTPPEPPVDDTTVPGFGAGATTVARVRATTAARASAARAEAAMPVALASSPAWPAQRSRRRRTRRRAPMTTMAGALDPILA